MIKIALLGDVHFGKYARSDEFASPGTKLQDNTKNAESIKKGIIKILKDEKVNYIFVAGDLTSTGSPMEYIDCESLLLEIAKNVGVKKRNVIVSLGNHDVDWRIASIEENNEGDQVDQRKTRDCYQSVAASVAELLFKKNSFKLKGPMPFSGLYEDDSVVVFILNSGFFCGPDDEISHGQIDLDQLKWFETKAEKYKESNKWKIILLHHHLFNYPYQSPSHDISLLEEGPEILEIAGRNGVHVVCHGHRHHPKAFNEFRDEWINPITFICCGSCAVNSIHRGNGEIPNCFHILELSNEDRIIKLLSYEYSASDGWGEIMNNCSATPIDKEMVFSRPYTEDERLNKIRELLGNLENETPFELPDWSELPIEIRTLKYHQINDALKKLCNEPFFVYGNYPDKVAIIRKE